MTVPEPVLEAIRAATLANLGDVEAAIPAAVAAVRALPDYRSHVATLVEVAVQELVYRERGKVTVAVSRAALAPPGPAKVDTSRCAAVLRVAQSVFNHCIGGARLGDMTGEALLATAETEAEIARGHAFNAALCQWCISQGVTGEKRVRDVISEDKLRRAYARLKRANEKAAGAGRAA